MDQRHDWHMEAVTPAIERVIESLGAHESLTSFYLAGGTALALWFGHRRSRDLDLFSGERFDADRLLDRLQAAWRLSVIGKDRETLHLHIDGVKVSLLGYPYPLLHAGERLSGLTIADARDIACMKLSALAGRGTRRDFVDVYVALQHIQLAELLTLFQRKYAGVNYSLLHLFKSLTYFGEAERDPMPDMLIPLAWEDVTAFFERVVPPLAGV